MNSSAKAAGIPSLAVLMLVAAFVSAAGTKTMPTSESRGEAWKLVYEHYDTLIGEGGAGIAIVTSRRRRPLALASRPRGAREHYSQPVFSPDGTRVAYTRSVSGRDELYVVRANGTGRRHLASGRIHDYVWSADGRQVAFAADCAYGFQGGCRNGHIDVIRRDATGRRVLLRPRGLSRGADLDLQQWSSGGGLLYLVRDRGRSRLYSVDSDGARSQLLADSRVDGSLGGASWSSDGRRIAYMRRCGETRVDTYCDLAVMARDGGSKRLLWRWGPGDRGPSYHAPPWIPRSSRVVLTVWGVEGHTRVLDVVTGRSRTITRTPWRDVAVSAGGERIATLDDTPGVPSVVIIARSDGAIVARSRLPRDPSRPSSWDGGYDLWVR